MKYLIALLFLVASHGIAHSQAFDGITDGKVFLGYTNLGGNSTLDLQLDYGLGDWFSAGAQVTHLLLPADKTPSYTFSEKTNLTFFGRVHFSGIFTMPSKFTPYAGVDIGLNGLGVHAGAKYNFGERWGVYVQTLQGLLRYGETDDIRSTLFSKKWGASLGITYNLF